MEQFINIIIWAAIIQGFLLGILFISSKEHSSWSNKLLGFFLLSLLIEAINALLTIDNIFGYPIDYYFRMPETKILFPIFFIHYVLEKLGRTSAYLRYLKINYTIAGIVILLTIYNFGLHVFTGNNLVDYYGSLPIDIVFFSQQTYGFLLSLIAITISLKEIRLYRRHAENEFSDLDKISVTWLWRFVVLLIPSTLLWGAELTRIFIGYYTGEWTDWDFVETTYAIITIFIYVVSYQAFKQNDLFKGIERDKDILADLPQSIERSAKGMNDELELPLRDSMEEDQLYLKNDLTIFDVAKHVGASSKKVSSCINSCFGANFSEWVNRFRVDEVKLRIDNPENDYLTIEAIGQESGFKSRSAMYTAFKKFTGESPAKLRNTTLS